MICCEMRFTRTSLLLAYHWLHYILGRLLCLLKEAHIQRRPKDIFEALAILLQMRNILDRFSDFVKSIHHVHIFLMHALILALVQVKRCDLTREVMFLRLGRARAEWRHKVD